jgi:hypothetical protein
MHICTHIWPSSSFAVNSGLNWVKKLSPDHTGNGRVVVRKQRFRRQRSVRAPFFPGKYRIYFAKKIPSLTSFLPKCKQSLRPHFLYCQEWDFRRKNDKNFYSLFFVRVISFSNQHVSKFAAYMIISLDDINPLRQTKASWLLSSIF